MPICFILLSNAADSTTEVLQLHYGTKRPNRTSLCRLVYRREISIRGGVIFVFY